jgi:hypothetical protein
VHQANRLLVALVAVALGVLSGPVAITRADHGSQAVDLFGKFVSFNNSVLTVGVTKGKYAGQYTLNIPDGIPVLVYMSAGHPKMFSSPNGFSGVTADTPIEVNIDSRQRILRICIGDTKPAKTPKAPK